MFIGRGLDDLNRGCIVQSYVMKVETICCVLSIIVSVGLGLFSFLKKKEWELEDGAPVGFWTRIEAEAIDLGRAVLLWVIVQTIAYIIIVCVFLDKLYGFEYNPSVSWQILVASVYFLVPLSIHAYQMTRPGQTWGYRRMQIRVVNLHGGPPSFAQACLVKILSFVCLITGGLGFLGVYVPVLRRPFPDWLGGLRAVSLPDSDYEGFLGGREKAG